VLKERAKNSLVRDYLDQEVICLQNERAELLSERERYAKVSEAEK
jgi:hypothetical protein